MRTILRIKSCCRTSVVLPFRTLVHSLDIYFCISPRCHLNFVFRFFFLMIRRPPRSTLFPYTTALPILSQSRAFPDDEVELVIRISNRKPLPLVALSIRELVPAALQVIGYDKMLDTEGRQVLSRSTSLRWYESVVWRYRMRCTARGAYRLGPAQIEGGDPFGFHRTVKDISDRTSLIVYPRLLPLEQLGLPPRHPLGDLRARQLIRDP